MKYVYLILSVILFTVFVNAQQMQIHKNDQTTVSFNLSEIDSITFSIPDTSNTVTDIDGNVYHTVIIGTQVWMVENLKTSRYRNGVSIPNVTDDTQWNNDTTGAYCNYNNDTSNATTYGRLYNWYAVNNGNNIAPAGWHVPSDAEWTTLTTFLGGESVAGGKLKEAGLAHWTTPNTGATNESGFTALPSGYRSTFGGTFFLDLHNIGIWWSATGSSAVNAWYRLMGYDMANVNRGQYVKKDGYSVRCVRD